VKRNKNEESIGERFNGIVSGQLYCWLLFNLSADSTGKNPVKEGARRKNKVKWFSEPPNGGSHWNENELTIRIFKVPRFCNLIFSVEDLQGDGFVRLTLSCFYRAVQIYFPFNNNSKRFNLDWRIFR
jgi:hypothetical protein